VGSAVGLGDAQIREEEGHRLRGHGRAPVGMNGELPRPNGLFATGFLDEALGQGCRFPVSNHPADHIAAEDIQNDVEVIIGPLGWAKQLGDVP